MFIPQFFAILRKHGVALALSIFVFFERFSQEMLFLLEITHRYSDECFRVFFVAFHEISRIFVQLYLQKSAKYVLRHVTACYRPLGLMLPRARVG